MLANAVRNFDYPWGEYGEAAPVAERDWTVLIPFFNERRYLPRTIASLAAQDVGFRLILIDNGSTDGGADAAAATCRKLGVSFTLLTERRPGKVFALSTGLAQVRTRYVATCDADTWYPAHYLSAAATLLGDGAVAAGAYFVGENADDAARKRSAWHIRIAARLLPRQCHTGGAGQTFRTDSLRRAGGFDAARWNWVLEDHEIMHRVVAVGAIAYGGDFWCAPAPRDRDRNSIRWTLAERILYHTAPDQARDWFFYNFLANRLRARRLFSARIRERQFQDAGGLNDAAAHIVCG